MGIEIIFRDAHLCLFLNLLSLYYTRKTHASDAKKKNLIIKHACMSDDVGKKMEKNRKIIRERRQKRKMLTKVAE